MELITNAGRAQIESSTHHIKSLQWLQNVGCLKNRATNLCPFTSWTFFWRRAPLRWTPPPGAPCPSPEGDRGWRQSPFLFPSLPDAASSATPASAIFFGNQSRQPAAVNRWCAGTQLNTGTSCCCSYSCCSIIAAVEPNHLRCPMQMLWCWGRINLSVYITDLVYIHHQLGIFVDLGAGKVIFSLRFKFIYGILTSPDFFAALLNVLPQKSEFNSI